MLCDKCGNVIPDGASVCPNCGFKVYATDDANMEDLLSELSIALDDLGANDPSVPDSAQIVGNETETVELTLDDEEKNENLVEDLFAAGAAEETEVRKKRKVEKTETQSTAEKKKAAKGKKSSGAKKKKKKSSGGSGVLGVIIGLLFALLLIACAAGFMLYKMGFFSTLKSTDDELLNNTASISAQGAAEGTTVVAQAVETSPEVSVLPSPNATADVASVLEPESTTEPEEEQEETATRFELTGDDYFKFYSRGSTAQVEYEIEPESAKERIVWSVDNDVIASVSDEGVISARRGGSCVVTGTCDDLTITVEIACEFNVPETVLDMNYEDVTLSYEGQTVELYIDYEGLTLAQKEATVWESSDESIATVDEDGVVTAVSDGTAVISASIKDYTASCIIRCINVSGNKGVNSSQAEYVINYEDVTLTRKGEYFRLELSSISGGEAPEVTWRSSDKSVATVNKDGVVTAVSNGTAYITCSVDGFDFECIVRVNY